jgi:hypothetical protein
MSRLFGRATIALTTMLVVAGCASTQLNYNTLDIASTYDQLITKQITVNIKKSLESKYGLPAFVKVTAGTATTTNSVTPSGTAALSTGITSAAQTTAAGLFNGSTRTTSRAGPGLSVSASDQWSQTYTLTPVIDTDQLRRLRALYQYVTRQLPYGDQEFECGYPLIETGASAGAESGGGAATQTTVTVTVDDKPVKVTLNTAPSKASVPKTIYVRRAFKTTEEGKFQGYTWVQVSPDVTFIQMPGCILCDYGRALTADDMNFLPQNSSLRKNATKVHKLEKNIALRNDWLVLPGDDIPTDAIALPSNGLETIYVRGAYFGEAAFGLKYFNEFALFTEDASSQGTGSPASSGQSLGRKTPNTERISIPVAAGGTALAP